MTVDSTQPEDLRIDPRALFAALRARALRIGIVTLLLVVAAFVLLLFVPKMYESSASLLVEDRSNSFTEMPGATSPSNSGVTIDAVVSSQIELIKSRDTLLAVIDSQDLRSVPEFAGGGGNPLTMILSLAGRKPQPTSSDEVVLQNLSSRLAVAREGASAVISIAVQSADPALAARIANAIAAEHVKRRAGQSLSDTQEATVWLQQQIDTLRVKVNDADTKVADYKAKNGIFAGSNGTTLPDQNISDVGKQISDAEALMSSVEQRASVIRARIKAGQSVDGVDDIRNSPTIQSLMQSKSTMQSSLAEKLATLLPGHPTIKALKAQIAQLDVQINAEARRVADGLDAQVTVQQGIVASLKDALARAKAESSAQTKDGVTLDSLTREANAQRDLLNAYLLKYRAASGQTDTGSVLPDVRVVAQAAPSVVPASPKTGLVLGAVAFVSVALQMGIVLFGELVSGRAIYNREAVAPETPVEPASDAAADPVSPLPDRAPVARPAASQVFATAPRADVDSFGPDAQMFIEPTASLPPQPAPADPSDLAPRRNARIDAQMALSNLAADLVLGRVRVLLLAGIADARDAAIVADALVTDALERGLSVCRVDAGSMRPSEGAGLTDLCADTAGYGDVVHKVRDGLAEVPWGTLVDLDRRSSKPLTLVEALADIYEVVIVAAGRMGPQSWLSLFAGSPGRLALVRQPGTPDAAIEAAEAGASLLGFAVDGAVMVPEPASQVA